MQPQPPLRSTHTSGGPKNLLVYDRWGEFGRPVVLLHDLSFDRTMWWPAAAELTGAACTVVAPDLPGHGQSPPRDDCCLDRLARDLAVLLNGLALHRAPIVAGHGASAWLAQQFSDAYATHAVITVDEPPTVVDVGAVPEPFRPYAKPQHRVPPKAYASWLPRRRTKRKRTAPPFWHLTDPKGFAAELRGHL